MTNLNDKTYFKGSINLPIDEIGGILEQIYIPMYQKEMLIDLLGYDLYKAFEDGLAESVPASKWTDLKNGADYQISTINYNWSGFANAEKISPIAYYTYFKYGNENVAHLTNSGAKVFNSENSSSEGVSVLLVNAYNRFLKLYNDCIKFIETKNAEDETTYPNFDPKIKGMVNTFNI